MSLTSEQTSKIKSAVKTKLVDIGAYVDDQLSDYVMIMITNKKTEKQMTEDLELFLGGLEQAQDFSTWLHVLIKKTLENKEIESSSKSSSHHHHSSSSNSSHRKSSSSGSKSSKNNNKSFNQNGSINLSHNEPDEGLAIQIDSNEFNDDFNENELDKKNSHKTDDKLKRKSSKDQKSTPNKETNVKIDINQEQKSKATLESTPIKEKEVRKEPVNLFSKLVSQESSKESTPKSKVPVIASRIRKVGGEEEDDEEEVESFDKKRLSSIVKISDREKRRERDSNIPKSLQPNKTILLKALDAANSSVKSQSLKSKSIADTKLEEIRSRRFIHNSSDSDSTSKTELFTLEQRAKRLKKFETNIEQNECEKTGDKGKGIFSNILENRLDTRQIIANTSEDRRNIQIDTDEMNHENEGLEVKRVIQTAAESTEPKFVVTMKGLEDHPFIKNLNKISPQKRTLDDMNDNFEDRLDYDEEEIIDEDIMEEDTAVEEIEVDEIDEAELQKKKLTRCSFWPMCDKGDQCQYLHPNKPCTAFPNCQFGNLCHYLHPSCRFDGFCTRPECPFTHVIKKPSAISIDSIKMNDGTILDGKAEIKAAASGSPAGTAGTATITIDKIQSTYTKNNYVNENNGQALTKTVMSTTTMNEAAGTNTNKFSLNNASQIRMPRAAAPSPYFKAHAYSFSPSAYSNQYSFVNRASNPSATMNINCKYGKMCQNPQCIYVHPNLPLQSQMKWTPASKTENSQNTPELQSSESLIIQETNVSNSPMIAQSS